MNDSLPESFTCSFLSVFSCIAITLILTKSAPILTQIVLTGAVYIRFIWLDTGSPLLAILLVQLITAYELKVVNGVREAI